MRKILYSKYSNDRDDKYAIRTNIVKDEFGNKCVQKYYLKEEGKAHFDNMKQAYQRLQEVYNHHNGQVNRYTEIENGLEFEFINGSTLDVLLKEVLEKKDIEKAKELLSQYFSFVECAAEDNNFVLTNEFKQVFGMPEIDFSQEKAADAADIDLILPNIIVNDTWNIIDYEWTFLFPIPMKFVMYRGMLYWFLENGNQLPLAWNEVMELAGITVEMEDQFKRMEEHFQKHILGEKVPAAEMRNLIDQEIISINPINVEQAKKSCIQIFFDRGEGFSDKDYISKKRKWSEHDKIHLFIEIAPGVKSIRLDPEEKECIVVVKKLSSGGKALEYLHNGKNIHDNIILFLTKDSNIVIQDVDELEQGIEVELEVYILNESMKHMVQNLQDQISQLQNDKENLAAEYSAMEQQHAIALAAYEESQDQLVRKMFFSRALYILKRESKNKSLAIGNKLKRMFRTN